MIVINTNKLQGKLEKLIDFRIREGAHKKHPIVVEERDSCPATDGTQIFLPRRTNRFKSPIDNELSIANSAAHEADHIREYEEYFGLEVGGLREQNPNLVEEFNERNYTDLTENPALADWIDNIVSDRRIDVQRREQLPGIERHYKETLLPAAKYMRPSTKGMTKLDAFREQYLQMALVEATVEPFPEENRAVLEEIVEITRTADSIHKNPEAVKRIYSIFKEHFNINQPISKLPSLFGTGKHSQSKGKSGSPQKGYGKEVKPREGRNPKDKKPKKLNTGKQRGRHDPNSSKTNGQENDTQSNDESPTNNNREGKDFYKESRQNYNIDVQIIKPTITTESTRKEREFRDRYAGESESMKRIFRQLQLKHYGDRRDFEGQELDYETYMQDELESRVTGIKGNGRHFRRETRNEQKPTFGIHADISGSTRGQIIEGIRAAFYIMGNALSVSDWNYGLYASGNELGVIKEPHKKWSDEINHSIMNLEAGNLGSGGIYLNSTSSVIGADLARTEGSPKGLIIVSDFQVCGGKTEERMAAKKLYDQKIYPFLIAIGENHETNAAEMAREIGSEHYSVIPLNKLHELPTEMFRLFKTFGIAR